MSYLFFMDRSKKEFLEQTDKNIESPVDYYYYLPIICEESNININSSFFAVKNYKTTILIVENESEIKVHFTDNDIKIIIEGIRREHLELYEYLHSECKKIIGGFVSKKFHIKLSEQLFEISGIPFIKKYNDVSIRNPADIVMYANEFILLFNLVLEKERTDSDKTKPIKFIKKTFNNMI